MKRLIHKHPLAIRWFHWANFPLLFVMIWSGLMIYWANDVYVVRVGGHVLFHFFPDGFYKRLHLPFMLARGLQWHFFFMWLFMVNGLLYVTYTAVSGEWRYLLPRRGTITNAWQTVLHDLHLSKHCPPIDKYNGAQRLAYTGVVLMGGGSLLTGLAIYKPATFSLVTHLLGGYGWARWEHFWLTVLYVAFFGVHIAQVARAGWNNFRSMISGYELVTVKEASDAIR